MDRMKLSDGRRMADQWLEEHRQEQLEAAEDESRRRLLNTLYTRQRDSMDYLSLIRLDLGNEKKPSDAPARQPGRLTSLLAHPLAGTGLAIVTLVFASMEMQLPTILSAVALLARALMMYAVPPKKERVIVAEVHEPYVNREELERFLRMQEDRIQADAESVIAQHAVSDIRTARGMEKDFGNIYCALYEAQVDDPGNGDLAYPLSIARMNLYKLGYEPVEYSEETAAMFDVLPVEGEDQLRCPALRSRENGVVLKKGLWLRGQ